ncbi:glycosyltransferase family 1 protein, partial [Paenibacillus sp. TAF58]
VYVDPHSVSDLSHSIRRLLAEPARRDELSALGRERSGRFTWAATAQQTVRSFQRALGAA